MEFEFVVPIKGEKMFLVKADSLDEAIYIMCNEDVDGDWCDQDFDLDAHESLGDFLRNQHG